MELKIDYDEDPDFDYFANYGDDEEAYNQSDIDERYEDDNIMIEPRQDHEQHNPNRIFNIGKCPYCKCDYNKRCNEKCAKCGRIVETVYWDQFGGE